MGLLALFWGSSFLWIKLALGGLSPTQLTLARALLGAAVLVVLCYSGGQRLPGDRRVWGHLVVAALFGNVIPFTLFGVGEQTVDSGVAGVLNATTPLWALLIGLVIGTERGRTPIRLLGLVLGFAGTVLIFAPWQSGGLLSWGALALVAAAASYAISFTYIAAFLSGKGTPATGPLALSAAQLTTAAGLSTLALPIGAVAPVQLTPVVLVSVAALGVFGSGFAFALHYRLIADEGATNAATVGYLLPVVSVLLGTVVLHEHLSARVLIGMAVVLTGVALTRMRGRITSAAVLTPAAR